LRLRRPKAGNYYRLDKKSFLLARQAASAGRLMLCLCYFLSSSFFFNERLEQRDLGNYKNDLHQIFRDGRHVGIDVQSGIGFAIKNVAILGVKSAEIGDTPSFLGLAFHNGWQDGKAGRRVNSAEVLPIKIWQTLVH